MKYQRSTTPIELFKELRELCNELVPDIEPVYVAVQNTEGHKKNDCFHNLPKHIEEHGGEMVIGWSIWHWPGVLVEGEYHCVWRNTNSELIDITPKENGASKVLFLEDQSLTYDGRMLENQRRALRSDPVFQEWFSLIAQQFEVYNRGERAYQYGTMDFNDEEMNELRVIHQKQALLQPKIMDYAKSVLPYSPCLGGCGSTNKRCECNKN